MRVSRDRGSVPVSFLEQYAGTSRSLTGNCTVGGGKDVTSRSQRIQVAVGIFEEP